jgi:hypothetical protein
MKDAYFLICQQCMGDCEIRKLKKSHWCLWLGNVITSVVFRLTSCDFNIVAENARLIGFRQFSCMQAHENYLSNQKNGTHSWNISLNCLEANESTEKKWTPRQNSSMLPLYCTYMISWTPQMEGTSKVEIRYLITYHLHVSSYFIITGAIMTWMILSKWSTGLSLEITFRKVQNHRFFTFILS